MFDLRELNDDTGSISYAQAQKRKPKPSKGFVVITPVAWDGAPQEFVSVKFHSVGESSLVKPLKLPNGYRMELHDSWLDVAQQIYTPERVKDLSFTELDDIVRDWHTLEDFVGRSLDWFNLYDDRPDYCHWSCSFDDTWDELAHELESKILAVFDRACPHRPPHSAENKDCIGNRVMAPSLHEALTAMFGADCANTMIKVLDDAKTTPDN